jgi:rare lipoprotein A
LRLPRASSALALFLVACAGSSPPVQSTVSVQSARPHGLVEEGKATWYGREHHGRLTANGERFDMYGMTAAHRTLRIGTRVRVTNLMNGKSVVVRINDRGPYAKGRIIDLSWAAAKEVDMIDRGVVPARVEVIH